MYTPNSLSHSYPSPRYNRYVLSVSLAIIICKTAILLLTDPHICQEVGVWSLFLAMERTQAEDDPEFTGDNSYVSYEDRKLSGKSEDNDSPPASREDLTNVMDSSDESLDSDDDSIDKSESEKRLIAPSDDDSADFGGKGKNSKGKNIFKAPNIDDSVDTDEGESPNRKDLSLNLEQEDIKGEEDKWKKTLNKRTIIIVLVFSFVLVAIVVPICIMNILEMLKIFQLESILKNNGNIPKDIINNRIAALENKGIKSDEYAKQLKTNLDSVQAKINNLDITLEDARSVFTPGYRRLLSSCAQIRERDSTSTSGYYFIKLSTGQLRSVYCEMERCGEGGWTRVANLDVDNCPAGFKSKQFGSISTCVTVKDKANCSPIIYSTLGIRHSRVCGKVRAYADGTPDSHSKSHSNNMNQNYLDGISITSNSEHVWSFFLGWCDSCNNHYNLNFLSTDWACSRAKSCQFRNGKFCNIELFSSQQCGTTLSMFHKDVKPSKSNLKVRVCRNQARTDEDIALKTIELYII